MPLVHSASKPAFQQNVKTLMNERGVSPHVKDKSQALAIAFATKRRAAQRAMGGPAPAPWFERAEARSLTHTGPILSAVPGRTDRHNMAVPSGSYVVPAETVSHLGQSNTLSGMKVLNGMFGPNGPYGMAGTMKVAHGAGAPRPPALSAMSDSGGARGKGTGAPVDVVTAGGEYVIPPEIVAKIGDGDLKRGHAALDAWIMDRRKDHLRTLKKLPGPAKS